MSVTTIETVGQRVEEVIAALQAHSSTAPKSGTWSSVQTLDHLIQVHRGLLLGLRTKETLPKRPFYFTIRRNMVELILSNAITVPAKGALPSCPADADFETFAQDFRKLHEKLVKRVTEGVDENLLVMNHPVAGPLNINEALKITEAHLVYHTKRAGR